MKSDGAKKFRLNSLELQLVDYSWPDPTQYTIEFVIYTIDSDEEYSERIVQVSYGINFVVIFENAFRRDAFK